MAIMFPVKVVVFFRSKRLQLVAIELSSDRCDATSVCYIRAYTELLT